MKAEILWAHLNTKYQPQVALFLCPFLFQERYSFTSETVCQREEMYNNSKEEVEFRLPPYILM